MPGKDRSGGHGNRFATDIDPGMQTKVMNIQPEQPYYDSIDEPGYYDKIVRISDIDTGMKLKITSSIDRIPATLVEDTYEETNFKDDGMSAFVTEFIEYESPDKTDYSD